MTLEIALENLQFWEKLRGSEWSCKTPFPLWCFLNCGPLITLHIFDTWMFLLPRLFVYTLAEHLKAAASSNYISDCSASSQTDSSLCARLTQACRKALLLAISSPAPRPMFSEAIKLQGRSVVQLHFHPQSFIAILICYKTEMYLYKSLCIRKMSMRGKTCPPFQGCNDIPRPNYSQIFN